jgi:hypothetical protein
MRCRVCGEEKEIERFCRDAAYSSGFSNRCRECKAVNDRKTYRNRTDAHRALMRVRRADKIHRVNDARKSEEWKNRNARQLLIYAARRSARDRGLEMTITRDDVKIPEFCPLLGIRLVRGAKSNRDFSPSLDRIDSSKGYVPGNVWVVSYRANRIKNNATPDELLMLATRLMDYETGKLCRESINLHPSYSQ